MAILDLRKHLKKLKRDYGAHEKVLEKAAKRAATLRKSEGEVSRSKLRAAVRHVDKARDDFEATEEALAGLELTIANYELALAGKPVRSAVVYLGSNPYYSARIKNSVHRGEAHAYKFDSIIDGKRILFVDDPFDLREFRLRREKVPGSLDTRAMFNIFVSDAHRDELGRHFEQDRFRNQEAWLKEADDLEVLGIS